MGRFIHECDESNSKDSSHIFAENEPSMKKNEAVLYSLIVLNGLFR